MTDTRLPSFALFAGVLAAAGLPIYIHAPKFFVDEYGVSLAALGGILFALRLIDVVQDPALGWIARKTNNARRHGVALAAFVMALAMVGLFAIAPPIAPLAWFAVTLAMLFSGYSFLSIVFYAQGVQKAASLGERGHVRLAGWRETGALIGVSLAAVAPTVLVAVSDAPFAVFAVVFAGAVALAVLAMGPEWTANTQDTPETSFGKFLADPMARRLLLIALLNAMPVAASSTLFLFFVEARLDAPGWEGPLLLVFFLAAAGAAPLWARAAMKYGPKPVLLCAMVLAIAAFSGAALLGAGHVWFFAVICILSGATMGADLTLLPAMFAARAAEITTEAAEGFGLWSFMTKLSLAVSAAVLLPLLDASGFRSGEPVQPDRALVTLTAMYAVLPCVLKVAAIALLAATPIDRGLAAAHLKEA